MLIIEKHYIKKGNETIVTQKHHTYFMLKKWSQDSCEHFNHCPAKRNAKKAHNNAMIKQMQ